MLTGSIVQSQEFDLNEIGQKIVSLNRSGKLDEALKESDRLLSLVEQESGKDSLDYAQALNFKGLTLSTLTKFAKAEPYVREALAIFKRKLPAKDQRVQMATMMLAAVYGGQGKSDLVRELMNSLPENSDSSDNELTAERAANRLIKLDIANPEHFEEAEKLYLVLYRELSKNLNPNTPDKARLDVSVGSFYVIANHCDKALPYLQKAIDFSRAHKNEVLIEYHSSLDNLARCYGKLGRHEDAQGAFEELISSGTIQFGEENSLLAFFHQGHAEYLHNTNQLVKAFEAGEIATEIYESRVARIGGLVPFDRLISHSGKLAFLNQITIANELGESDEGYADRTEQSSFLTAQRIVQSKAGFAVNQMTARLASGNAKVANSISDGLKLVDRWERLETRFLGALKNAQLNSSGQFSEIQNELKRLEGKISDINLEIRESAPEFDAHHNPAPLRIDQVQKYLTDNEALVLFLISADSAGGIEPSHSYVWVISKNNSQWKKIKTSERSIDELVKVRIG